MCATIFRQALNLMTLVACLAGCLGSEQSESHGGDVRELGVSVTAADTTSRAFQVGPRTSEVILERASGLASVLSNATVSAAQLTPERAALEARDWTADVNQRSMSVHYEPSFDMLTVIDNSVAEDEESTKDIGVDAAREMLRGALAGLIDRGVVEASLDADTAEVRQLVEGGGWVGEKPTERVKEYCFYVPLVVDGARVRKGNQEAGARIAVNRDGRLSSLRIAGPISHTSNGQAARQVTDEAIEARLAADFPNASIRRFGLSYVFDDADGAKAVLPRQAYYVSQRHTVAGRSIHARAQVVSYALDNPASAYRAWPTPGRDVAPGDIKPTQ
jgi:hypothetical protein